ncbi:MAG: chorismate synthase [Ignavibacteria bacterium]|jgi:chorismate synthase|nr:chorismate synthase [Ignavibacteria bacterium]
MNTFGSALRVSIFGQSHSSYLGVTIDGCPAGIHLTSADFTNDLTRRKASHIGATARVEPDIPTIVSGVFNNKTTGNAITIVFSNFNEHSEAYSPNIVRPSTSDFVANKKYNGNNDFRGSGMFSGRMTVTLVAAAVIAKKLIPNIRINAAIQSIGGLPYSPDDTSAIEAAQMEGDSLGGIIECTAKGVPVGLGEPYFDSCEGILSHLLFSISGVKGVEFGAGFAIANMKGSEANDCFSNSAGKTVTNKSGGINAGITNGNDVVFRVALRPTPSISKTQMTYNFATNKVEELSIGGRHDTCFALRVPVIIEAVTAIVLADLDMIHKMRANWKK